MQSTGSFVPRLLTLALLGGILWVLEKYRPWHPGGAGARRSRGANLMLAAVTIGLNAAFALVFAGIGVALASRGSGLLHYVEWPGWLETFMAILFLDLCAYFAHRLLHTFKPGWKFHRVHHSDPHVDVTTSLRQHPLETAWRYLFQFAGILCVGPSSAAVVIYVSLSGGNALLEHANLGLSHRLDSVLSKIFVTPNMHKNHHSCEQQWTDSNYANLFSIWDHIFRTYSAPKSKLVYGLDDLGNRKHRTFRELLWLPFDKGSNAGGDQSSLKPST